ncbi:hypothetical protein SKAU_G00309720 [Synaphobranchus kaupii]|uniref:Uncharacterized protein n=1 Tax=Synaphobranchus kaupii TaxID=118154 RepID=A0A9Q1ERE9_SYNKA|nr:hypothetical protein SKAU_G00309720 [Synaphobranchus kaupii]
MEKGLAVACGYWHVGCPNDAVVDTAWGKQLLCLTGAERSCVGGIVDKLSLAFQVPPSPIVRSLNFKSVLSCQIGWKRKLRTEPTRYQETNLRLHGSRLQSEGPHGGGMGRQDEAQLPCCLSRRPSAPTLDGSPQCSSTSSRNTPQTNTTGSFTGD